LASQIRVAFSSTASKTGSSRPGELLMTLLLQGLGKVLPSLGEFAPVCFKLPFQIGARLANLDHRVVAFVSKSAASTVQ
jgi:hypothetical protein